MSVATVIYSAAHGGFSSSSIPLGGGAAVCRLLLEEWRRAAPFAVELVSPSILGSQAPTGEDLVNFNERQYASFCRRFSDASTTAILRHDPASTAVLVNDISEAPDFARLAVAGFRIVTIYHVDVVAYIAAIYLHGRVSPSFLARAWERLDAARLTRLAPRILHLIFERQRESVRHSAAIAVPSSRTKEILVECYPEAVPSRIHVVPWGAPPVVEPDPDTSGLRAELGLGGTERVLLCLSRISPEKGQDLLLESLIDWERVRGDAVPPIRLLICGEPAFMHGRRHLQRLRRLAARLRRIRVDFPGYVSGARKQAFFRLADLYVFPSRHESYGLTLMEALAAGLPAAALDSDGTRDILDPACGVLVPRHRWREGLWREIERLLEQPERRASMSKAARACALARPFSLAAARLAEICPG